MTTRKQDDQAGTTARELRRGRPSRREEHYRPAPINAEERPSHETATPHELYRHEKARRTRTRDASADPLADAKREYKALLAAEAARGKGGRPRKNAARPGAALMRTTSAASVPDEDDVDELETDEIEVEVEIDADETEGADR